MIKARRVAVEIYRAFCNYGVGPLFGQTCPACGFKTFVCHRNELHPGLIADWGLNDTWVAYFNEREFHFCYKCYAKGRDRTFATTLVNIMNARLGTRAKTLKELIGTAPFRALKIAEVNSVGLLHAQFQRHPNLSYSEYGSKDPAVRHEDMLRLTYADDTFDVVLTSETFEHIPDFAAAQREVLRVLKPGGIHFFTIPVVWDRIATVQRASIENGTLVHHRPPSYHGPYESKLPDYLVFYEFGSDVIAWLESLGFKVTVHTHATNPALNVIEAEKPIAGSR